MNRLKNKLVALCVVLMLSTGLTVSSAQEVDINGDQQADNELMTEQRQKDQNTLFQYSTTNAMTKGLYDGHLKLSELKKHGNFGIGAINGLGGEMILLDNVYYLVDYEGNVKKLNESILTPFAMVTRFQTAQSSTINEPIDQEGLYALLDRSFSKNHNFYAIKITGTFEYLKARSVAKQTKPYPPLEEVNENQSIFEFRKVRGTLVGFKSPDFINGINVPGYHFHFLTEDRDAGGHVLDLQISEGIVETSGLTYFTLKLPQNTEFQNSSQ